MPGTKLSTKFIAAIFIVCALILYGCAGSTVSFGPLNFTTSQQPTGNLLYADPGVTIIRPGGEPVRYESGIEVGTGDTIETADGQAVIDYEDGNVVVLNRATRVQLGSIRLFFGELFARIQNITTRGGGTVITDELSASVEGTEYGVRRNLNQASGSPASVQVYVRQGHVSCKPGGGAQWSPVMVTGNHTFEVDGYDAAPAPRAADAEALSSWADEAERRLLKPRTPKIQGGLIVPMGQTPQSNPRQQDTADDDSTGVEVR